MVREKDTLSPKRLTRRLVGFLRSRSGIGAVEFALVAPFMIALYLSGSELSIAITMHRKVEHTAATLADLVAQSDSLDKAQLTGIYQLSKSLFAPYSATGLRLRVTSVYIDASGVSKVDWSCPTTGMTKLAQGAAFALPSGFSALRNRYMLVAETQFPYAPMTVSLFTGSFDMGATNYFDPRVGTKVTSTGCDSVTL